MKFFLGSFGKSLRRFTWECFPAVHSATNDKQAHIILIEFTSLHCYKVGQLAQPDTLFIIAVNGIRIGIELLV